jgi:hypothetical protein
MSQIHHECELERYIVEQLEKYINKEDGDLVGCEWF